MRPKERERREEEKKKKIRNPKQKQKNPDRILGLRDKKREGEGVKLAAAAKRRVFRRGRGKKGFVSVPCE